MTLNSSIIHSELATTLDAKSLFEINDFKFQYPFSDKWIIFAGKFSINRGDVVLISGASGGGKSTFLYALKGLIPQFIAGNMSGEVLFHGEPITSASMALKSKIALLQQNPDSQIINRLVLDELAFGLENLSLSRENILAKINEFAEKFAITPLLYRELISLSGGEKQKITLISLLLTEPEVLLLDEPTAFLDPEAAQLFMQYLQEIKGKVTIIIIEHNLHYLLALYPLNHHLTINQDGVYKSLSSPFQLSSNLGVTPELDFIRNPEFLDKNQAYERKLLLEVKNQLNFTLYSGEILGIIGKSGSGKTTLLRSLAGLIKTKNIVYLEGVDIASISQKALYQQVGLLFQNPEHHFLFESVAEELNHNEYWLTKFSLNNQLTQNPFTLSEGQKRRLSFATLCVSGMRKLWLLDEPTFGQDSKHKKILIELILTLKNAGAAFIIVSHDYTFIAEVSDRVLELQDKHLHEIKDLKLYNYA